MNESTNEESMGEAMNVFFPYRSIMLALPKGWTEDARNPSEFIFYRDPDMPQIVLKVRRVDFRLAASAENAVGMREFFGGSEGGEEDFDRVFRRIIAQLRDRDYFGEETLQCADGSPLITYRKQVREKNVPETLVRCWIRGTSAPDGEFIVAFFSFSAPLSMALTEPVESRARMIERSVIASEILTLEQAVGLAAETKGGDLSTALTGKEDKEDADPPGEQG